MENKQMSSELLKSPSKVFNTMYNGQKNFITPNVVEYGSFDMPNDEFLLYEISSGEGFNRETVYGLTFLLAKKEDRDLMTVSKMLDFNGCHESIEKAKKAMNVAKAYVRGADFSDF